MWRNMRRWSLRSHAELHAFRIDVGGITHACQIRVEFTTSCGGDGLWGWNKEGTGASLQRRPEAVFGANSDGAGDGGYGYGYDGGGYRLCGFPVPGRS